MITFALESVDTAFDAYAMHWLAEYHGELARTGVRKFDLTNVEQYRQFQKAGGLRLMVARDETGMAIGFCTFFVMRSAQAAELVAQSDMLFVRPDKRAHLIGLDMVARMMKGLKEEGVTLFRATSSTRTDSSALWRWLGFSMTGMIYERGTDDNAGDSSVRARC